MSKTTNQQQAAPLRFQERDGQILLAIHSHDGLLARRQIKQLFWRQASQQAVDRRLGLLQTNGYLTIPTLQERRTHPIPEPVVWLGWRGILHLAAQAGLDVSAPNLPNESRLRRLEQELRAAGLRWLREPRWSQLAHDIAVNDFRMAVEAAVALWPSLSLETWIPEGEFLSQMDSVIVPGNQRRKGVRPDGFFILTNHLRQIGNSPAKARFLLELDNSTHPLSRFGREKARTGLAYIHSQEYRERFGYNSGRWLVVCKSRARLMNLKGQTEKILGRQAKLFLFTTISEVQPHTVLSVPIWIAGGSSQAQPLIPDIGVAP